MKIHLTTAALVLAAFPALAQTSGVAHPDPDVISATEDNAAQVSPAERTPSAEKPSAAIAAPANPVVYGAYVPYTGPKAASTTTADDGDEADLPAVSNGDVDAQIITTLPDRTGQLREGTLLKTQIKETLSTSSTVAGSRFTAEVMEPVEKDGKVVIPVGSLLEGRVTEVHGGRRITGAASLHLETRNVMLPDGTHYIVHAQLVDTGRSDFRVDNEGTLKRKDHPKEMLAVAGGVTGAGAATGAVAAGPVGAAVGAGIGAGVSTVIWLKQDRQATLPKDELLVFTLIAPMNLRPLAASASASHAPTLSGAQ